MATPITCPTTSSNVVSLASTSATVTLMGWSLRETAGAATNVDLKIGGSSGAVAASIRLAANGDSQAWLGDEGVLINSSILYATVSASGIAGSIWIK